MQVVGRDLKVLAREAEVVRQALLDTPGTADVQVRDSPGMPELHVAVDHEATARVGLPAGAVAMQVRLASQGEIAGKLRQGRSEAEIRVRIAGDERDSAAAFDRMWIYSLKGPVALSQLARSTHAEGPAMVEHEQRERQIAVTSDRAPSSAPAGAPRRLHGVVGSRAPAGRRGA